MSFAAIPSARSTRRCSNFRIDDTQRFEEDELDRIHQAARDVLIHALETRIETPVHAAE